MKKIKDFSSWCYKVINIKVFIAGTFLFIFFMIFILPIMAEQSMAITGIKASPDTSFVYNAQDLYSMADTYGAEGRNHYIQARYTFDVIWPVVYLLFLVSSITIIFRNFDLKSQWRLVNIMPLGGVFFDFFENISASIVMYRYPLTTPVIAELTPIFTLLKWSFIGLSFVAILIGLIILIIPKLLPM